MDEMIRVRLRTINDSVESLIKNATNILSLLPKDKTIIQEARVVANKLKTLNERFISEMYKYYQLVKTPSADEAKQFMSIQTQAEELVAEIEVTANMLQKEVGQPTETIGFNTTSNLPRMELARFEGDILKWHQFWDQFTSNVDSRKINDVDKLLYLQSVLGGEAKQAIAGLDTTSKNYAIAVNTLKERYGKPGVIVDAHYVALYRIQTAGSSIQECRSVFNEIERHLRVLQSLGEDVNHNHLRVMIMEKFPEDLIYELRIKLDTEDESIETIRKYLEHIISARETSNRLMRQVTLENSAKGNCTIESFHVKTENKQRNKKCQDETQSKNYAIGKRPNDHVEFNKSNQRKRHYEFNRTKKREDSRPKKMKSGCIFCSENHYNDECSKVKTIYDRRAKLSEQCYNCLKKGHKAKDCRSKRNCYHCGKYGHHNRALCPARIYTKVNTKTLQVNNIKTITLLQTCTVKVYKQQNDSRFVTCRILLDCGSQRSYITSKVAKKLDLTVLEETRLSVFTFGTQIPQEMESPVVIFDIVTRTHNARTINANVVPHITKSVACPFDIIRNINEMVPDKRIVLADDGSRNDQIDILIGNDYYYSFISNQKIKVEKDLYLVNTEFGWVWSGKSPIPEDKRDQLSVLTYFQANKEPDSYFYEPDLPLRNDSLKQLWDLESIGITDSPKSSRDEEAIENYNKTTKYVNNRYYVRWPWTEYPPTTLPVNLGLAYGRLSNLIKRLEPGVIDAYHNVLQDQLNRGIIEKINESTLPTDHPVHYLPHHCVLQEEKLNKLRIVYDASAKTKYSSSLNENLYRGPLMLEDLTGLLIRFREHNIGIVADVEKAFLQIGLQQNDRDVTRFLWIKNAKNEVSTENLQHFRFCRVPFGIISSPFLLNATIRYHLCKSDDNMNKQMAGDIYVDNLITGTKNLTEATTLYKTAKRTFEELSMNLCKWNSNCKGLMSQLSQEDRDENNVIKILGIEWDTNTDELKLKPKYETTETINTKRGVLKVTASIYDPCGFVAPMVLPAKLLLQELWKQKVKWDETLPQEMEVKWKNILYELEHIKDISIPRLYFHGNTSQISNETKYELHCFSDASMQSYAAVVYLRSYNNKLNNASISFVMGKSKLAPVKDQNNLQIPKLELLGAVIGNRLLIYVKKFLRVHIQKQFLWVDSEVVLNWYNSEKLLPPFVARRINEVKQNKNLYMRYVPTKLNPADGATRSLNTKANNRYWLSGPEYLIYSPDKWPESSRKDKCIVLSQTQTSSVGEGLSIDNEVILEDQNILDCTENLEVREQMKSDSNGETEIDTDSLNKHKNNGQKENHADILRDEKKEDNTIKDIIRLQKEHFPKEVQDMKTDLSRSLNLFKDMHGILRCAGRFQNINWTEDKKHPILLPKNCEFTTKLIETTHKNNYHVGVGHTLAITRNKYWILQGRSQVQKVLRNCIQCTKYGGGPFRMPLMPPLPPERVRYSDPFTFVGMDYFGPFKIDENSMNKRWVSLFTCLSVRAIHMEVVKDLSAEECVMAIRRFVAVRGLPQVFITDNATQFKLTSEVLTSNYCVKNNISWRFTPELAPWFGGFYERLIGIVKNCLKRTLDKHLVNHSQLCTIIKEVEAVVNTRPLTPVSQDLEEILTPAHFLKLGGPLLTKASDEEFPENITMTKKNLIQGWKRNQIMLEEYVKMFTNQYLTSLRERGCTHKQHRVVVNRTPKVGDIVQIKGDFSNRAIWKVGRISEVMPGADGQIRVAKVTLPKGETLIRSIGHLYPLELEEKQTAQLNAPEQSTNQTDSNGDTLKSSSSSQASQREDQLTDGVLRPKRASAQRAREIVKQWTKELASLIL